MNSESSHEPRFTNYEMYELNDTIVAVSSPSSGQRVIVRISGSKTVDILQQIFSPPISSLVACRSWPGSRSTGHRAPASLIVGKVTIDDELSIEAKLYLFLAPHSYTGDDVAEIHIHTNPSVTAAIIGNLLSRGLRMAGPGEFTARAYLNGKIDLAQAEAVNEIIVGSNKFQLAAAEKLLAGRLAETTAQIRSALVDLLSLIEASLDFSGEDIEFISCPEAVKRLAEIKGDLEQLLCRRYRDESVIDLPAVGIAGAPNAGKSSLLNKLLGKGRSIVSDQRKTTRDVLTGMLTLRHCRCVLFDCAGLTGDPGHLSRDPSDETILDELAQQAAIEALRNSSVVVFCIDISKADYSEDLSIWPIANLDCRQTSRTGPIANADRPFAIGDKPDPVVILVATKSDSLTRRGGVTSRLAELNELFGSRGTGHGAHFIPTSAKTGSGVEMLRDAIDKKVLDTGYGILDARDVSRIENRESSIALTARHKQRVCEAIENITECVGLLDPFRAPEGKVSNRVDGISKIKQEESCKSCLTEEDVRLRTFGRAHSRPSVEAPPWEVAAMMLRAAYQAVSSIETERLDEQILERIFSRFCIGK